MNFLFASLNVVFKYTFRKNLVLFESQKIFTDQHLRFNAYIYIYMEEIVSWKKERRSVSIAFRNFRSNILFPARDRIVLLSRFSEQKSVRGKISIEIFPRHDLFANRFSCNVRDKYRNVSEIKFFTSQRRVSGTKIQFWEEKRCARSTMGNPFFLGKFLEKRAHSIPSSSTLNETKGSILLARGISFKNSYRTLGNSLGLNRNIFLGRVISGGEGEGGGGGGERKTKNLVRALR